MAALLGDIIAPKLIKILLKFGFSGLCVHGIYNKQNRSLKSFLWGYVLNWIRVS